MHGTKPVAENLIAHRSYQASYPENTQLSLSKAIGAIPIPLLATSGLLPMVSLFIMRLM